MASDKTFIIRSFSLENTPENKQFLKTMEELGRKDGWTFSQLVREALAEYGKRHYPGNPQLDLSHWTMGMAMPLTVQERSLKIPDHNWVSPRAGIWICSDKGCFEGWFQP